MKKLLFLLLVFTSCAPVYVPNIRNSPMFTKGGEVQATIQIGNGFDAQTSASITKNIGLIANYSLIDKDRFDPDNPNDYHRHTYLEGGLGYFNNKLRKMVFEFFIGYGKGEGSSYDEFYFFGTQTVQATGKYQRYFIQPAFGLNRKPLQVSFVSRISMVDFTEFSNNGTYVKDNEKPLVYVEPAVIFRINGRNNHLFFTFQAGFSGAIKETYFDHRAFQFATGLGARLGGIKSEETYK